MGGSAENSMTWNDSIIALGGVIGTGAKGRSEEMGMFELEHLHKWWISGGSTRTGAKRARVDRMGLLSGKDHASRPDAEEAG